MIENNTDMHVLLLKLEAPKRLIDHVKIVGATADELLTHLQELGILLNDEQVRMGAACHDAAKIVHPNELNEPGSLHEGAGEKLLLENGVTPEVVRYCKSHAQYKDMEVSFEELLVALADKLWKGKSVAELELLVVDATASALKRDRWDIFESLDMCFEKIASDGDIRLTFTQQA